MAQPAFLRVLGEGGGGSDPRGQVGRQGKGFAAPELATCLAAEFMAPEAGLVAALDNAWKLTALGTE